MTPLGLALIVTLFVVATSAGLARMAPNGPASSTFFDDAR